LTVVAVPEAEPQTEEDIPLVLPVDEAAPGSISASPTPRVPVHPAPRCAERDLRRDRAPAPTPNVGLIVGLIAAGVLLTCGLAGFGVYVLRQVVSEDRAMSDAIAAHRQRVQDRAEEFDREQAQAGQQQRRVEERLLQEMRRDEELRKEMERRAVELRQEVEARRAAEDHRRQKQAAQERLNRLNKPLAEVTIPAAQAGSEVLAATRNKGNGLTWAILPLGTPAAREPLSRPDPFFQTPFVAGAGWAADGRSFFVLTRPGVLRRIGYPDLKEVRKVDFKQDCHALGFCKFGLLITLGQRQEIWIVNPDTLAVVKRFGVSQLLKALTGPTLGIAYVFCREEGPFNAEAGLPFRLDLEDGTFAAMRPARDPAVRQGFPWAGFGYPALSPDGKWLFADGGALLRYRIDGTTLTLDAASHTGMGGGHKEGICVSPDSQWVCFPNGGGNDGLNYATYVYRTADLSRPAFILHQGAYPEVVGYDPAGQRLFSQNYDLPLIVFDANGTKRGEHKFGSVSGSHNVKQYAGHPTDGRGLLVRTNESLLLVEFTR
jgi:hypothetical protein